MTIKLPTSFTISTNEVVIPKQMIQNKWKNVENVLKLKEEEEEREARKGGESD